jgi:hypothetical protein
VRIAIIVPRVFDYVVASVVEGLEELGQDYITSEPYFNSKVAESIIEFINFAANADLVLLTSNQTTPEWVTQLIGRTRAVFGYIDGNDQSAQLAPRNIPFSVLFKRELLKNDPSRLIPGMFPLPFAALKRWIFPPSNKTILLSYLVNRYNNPLRNYIFYELLSYQRKDFLLGHTGESSNTGELRIGATDTYTTALRSSLCAVSVPGAGFDCARFWEILGAHTLLISYEPPIEIPHPFVDGKHVLFFTNLQELRDKIDFAINNRQAIIEILNEGKRHLLQFHSCKARAQYLINSVKIILSNPVQLDLSRLSPI